MSYQIASCVDTIQQKDNICSGQNVLSFSNENGALDLLLTKDKVNSREVVQTAWTKIPFGVKRDATEGLRLPKQMSASDRTSGLQQTTLRPGRDEEEKTRKNINITDVADKFLLGTMNALSHLEGDSSIGTASSVWTGLFCPETARVDTDSAIEHSSNGSSSLTDYSVAPRDQLCSPQKKSRPNRRPSRPPLLPPCRICGDRASGYHYGVNTCEACKGFFRRSICKTGPYICTGTGDCTTFGGKRTSCSHCRLKRCIAMGMSKNAIKTGRYTHELRSKNILEVKRLQKQGSDESSDISLEEASSVDMNYTEYQNELFRKAMLEETLGVLVSGQKMLYEFLDDYYNDELIGERQLSVYRNYMERKQLLELNEPYTAQTERHAVETERYTAKVLECNVAKADHPPVKHNNEHIRTGKNNTEVKDCPLNLVRSECNDFSMCSTETESSAEHGEVDVEVTDNVRKMQLKSHDRADSTPNETDERTEICEGKSRELNSANETRIEKTATIKPDDSAIPRKERLRAEVMAKIINDMEQGVQGMLAFAKCLPGFVELATQDQASLLKAARFDIWYIGHIRCFNVELRVGACEWQFHAEELAQVWGESMVDLAFKLSRVAQLLDLTKDESAALRAVCLTFPDRCMDLQNREDVELMHAHMLEVFKYVSCKRRADYNKWFPKVINFLVMLREFGVKFESVSSQLKLDWLVLKDNPLLLSVFLS